MNKKLTNIALILIFISSLFLSGCSFNEVSQKEDDLKIVENLLKKQADKTLTIENTYDLENNSPFTSFITTPLSDGEKNILTKMKIAQSKQGNIKIKDVKVFDVKNKGDYKEVKIEYTANTEIEGKEISQQMGGDIVLHNVNGKWKQVLYGIISSAKINQPSISCSDNQKHDFEAYGNIGKTFDNNTVVHLTIKNNEDTTYLVGYKGIRITAITDKGEFKSTAINKYQLPEINQSFPFIKTSPLWLIIPFEKLDGEIKQIKIENMYIVNNGKINETNPIKLEVNM